MVMELRTRALFVTAARWSPDGERILTVANDNRLKIWDAITGRELLNVNLSEFGLDHDLHSRRRPYDRGHLRPASGSH